MNDSGKTPSDDTLEEYLAGDSPLSRRYRESNDEAPPAEIDARIIAAAREQAGEPPPVFPVPVPPRRWFVPLSVAATVVLSFSLVMSLVFQTPEMMDQMPVIATDAAYNGAPAGETIAREMAKAPDTRPREQAPAAPRAEPVRPESVPAAAFKRSAGLSEQALDDAMSEIAPQIEFEAANLAPAARDTSVLAAALKEFAPSPPPPAAASDATRALSAGPPRRLDEATTALADALSAFEAGDDESALRRLGEFAEQRPDHPASAVFRDWQKGKLRP